MNRMTLLITPRRNPRLMPIARVIAIAVLTVGSVRAEEAVVSRPAQQSAERFGEHLQSTAHHVIEVTRRGLHRALDATARGTHRAAQAVQHAAERAKNSFHSV